MPLHTAPEPANGTALVREHIQHLAQRRPALRSAISEGPSGTQIQAPHRIYDLRADEVAAGQGLDAAHPDGFSYLVGAPGTPIASAEVHSDASGAAQLVSGVNYGRFVQSSAQALQRVAALPQTQTGSYEVRLLRFSAIPVLALWLKDEAGSSDIIYPLSPTPDVLEPERPYTPQQFLSVLVPLAQSRAQSTGPMLP